MANNIFSANSLTGGTAGDLDDIDHNNISDGDIALAIDASNDKTYFYRYNASSAAAESSPDTINPDSHAAENGRWILSTTQAAASYLRDILQQTAISGFLDKIGVQYDYLWIPASAFKPATTNGCDAVNGYEFTTNYAMCQYLAFDGATEQYADVDVVFPPTWDRSTISAKFYWTPASGASAANTVEWQIQGISIRNDDDIDGVAFTDTGEVITDTVLAGADSDLHITAKTPDVTINGTAGLGNMVHLKVSRNVGGTDDMAEDAWLFGVLIQYKRTVEVSAW